MKKNKGAIALGVVFALFILFLVISPDENEGGQQQNKKTEGRQSFFAIKEGFQPEYKINSKESDGQMIRIKIMIPGNLSREDLINNMKNVAKESFDKDKSLKNIVVWAYKDGTAVDGPYTAGMLDVAIDPEITAKTEINEVYFQTCKTFNNGTEVTLQNLDNKEKSKNIETVKVPIYSDWNYSEQNMKGEKDVKPRATVIDSKCVQVADIFVKMHKLEMISGANKLEGWVRPFHIKELSGN